MLEERLGGVQLVAMNTDAAALTALSRSGVAERVQLGARLTRGLGAGARPEVGRRAAEESAAAIERAVAAADLLVLTAGMGGGTGTGAAPVVAERAREAGALTMAVVTTPFPFEGRRRLEQARAGVAALQGLVDTLVVVENARLLPSLGASTALDEAFRRADEILVRAVQGIATLVGVAGLINVDFADVRTIVARGGLGRIGLGIARGGGRAAAAARQALASPLLAEVPLAGARGVLLNIAGGDDLTLGEVHEVSEAVQAAVGDDAEIIFGAMHDAALHGELRVTVIATGLPGSAAPPARAPFSTGGGRGRRSDA
jgi:cell division protein FtsZ